MVKASLTQRIDATEFLPRVPRPSSTPRSRVRLLTRSTLHPMAEQAGTSAADRPTADRAIDKGSAFANPAHLARWAQVTGMALAVIAGAVVLDFLVLWIAAGRLVERLPF
jgi:hypothetical protein